MDATTATTVMQYIIGTLMALLPAVVWGYIFYRKSPENKKTVLASFLAGIFSVIPMFVWQHNWGFSFNFLGVKIPGLNIYEFVRVLSASPSLKNVLIFIIIAIAISLLIYVSAAVIIFVTNILLGNKIEDSFKNVFRRSGEEPLIFISTGILIAVMIVVVSMLLSLFISSEGVNKFIYASFWSSMMIGFLEEYSKHLVVRFSDDNTIYSIDSAMEYSIVAGLGFAFLENILYFVDKIWLAPCSGAEIANNECLRDVVTNVYVHQAGIMLLPFIFRSLLSTLAHLIFSGVFGYFYGVAHFASYELQESEKKKGSMRFWKTLHNLFHMKTSFVFHEMKMLQGLLAAMIFHGLFDFVLDQNLTFLTVPMIFLGFFYLSYLFNKKDNHKKLRLIVDQRTSSREEFKEAVDRIEMLEKFEDDYLKKKEDVEKKHSLTEIEKNVELLEKYEEEIKKKDHAEEKDATKNKRYNF